MHTIVINTPEGIVGDEVKLSLPKTKTYMNIREVEVFGVFYGSSAEVTNIALNKPTSSSSTYGSRYDSSKAVDGIKSGDALFYSGKMENNWWKVSLGNIEQIRRIGIFNRFHCCGDRLRGYQVGIYKSGNATYIYDDENPSSFPGHTIVIDIPGEVFGDEVKLSLPGRTDYINIREVEVYKVSYAPSAAPTRTPHGSPTTAPSATGTTLAPTRGKSEDQCDGLDQENCASVRSCKYSNKKKLKGCAAKKEHDCTQHPEQQSCDGTAEGICQWKGGVCSHTCDGIKKQKECKKKVTNISKDKMCKPTKNKNPCFGCHAKSKC